MRYFLWILAHDRLLTNYGRWRSLADISDYQSCSGKREDVLHAIRNCLSARGVWELILPQRLRGSFFTWDRQRWLEYNLNFKDEQRWGLEWPVAMAIVSWLNWKWRNAYTFESEDVLLNMKLLCIQRSLEETANAWKGESLEDNLFGPSGLPRFVSHL